MKYRTVTVREGELVGPIPADYDFLQHFQGYCCDDEGKRKICDQRLDVLKSISTGEPTDWEVSLSGGYWKPLYAVGMYDGWPFWKPTPAVLTGGVLGSEWHFFYDLIDCRRIQAAAPGGAQ